MRTAHLGSFHFFLYFTLYYFKNIVSFFIKIQLIFKNHHVNRQVSCQNYNLSQKKLKFFLFGR